MAFFKDVIHEEAQDVFLNGDEFGEMLVVDGVEMPVLWAEESQSGEDYHDASVHAFAVNVETSTLIVFEGSMDKPAPDQKMMIDGDYWNVRKAFIEKGLIRIELYRNTA